MIQAEPETPLFGEGIPVAPPASGPVASAVSGARVLLDGIGSAFGASPEGRRYVGAAVVVAGIAIIGLLIYRARGRRH